MEDLEDDDAEQEFRDSIVEEFHASGYLPVFNNIVINGRILLTSCPRCHRFNQPSRPHIINGICCICGFNVNKYLSPDGKAETWGGL